MNTGDAAELTTKRRKKETTLREAIIKRLKMKFECDGWEAAKTWFDNRCADFSGEKDWPSIYEEGYHFLSEEKKLLDNDEKQRQFDLALFNGLSIGGNVGQQNILFGSTPQVGYHSSKPKMEGT